MNAALDRVTIASSSKHGKSVERRVTGIHNGVEVISCEAEIKRVARLGTAQTFRIIVLRDIVRIAVVVVREHAAMLHVLGCVQCNP